MAISTPTKTHINVVATTFDYSAKSNLGQIRTGSYLSQASMLVYDDILRFQNSTDTPTADISNFNYNQFEGNILWFMDELVGMESDWIQDASPGIKGNTAYGYVQFTEDSVETAVNRYIGHLERFNERSADRGWEPYSIKKDETLPTPEWLIILKNSTKTHEEKLDALTYDEVLALAFVHLHSKKSKDSNFVLLSEGDIYASKELYKNNHHTNPDAATLTRLEGFFPWRKQNKYVEKLAHAVSAVPGTEWMHKHCSGDVNLYSSTPIDVMNLIRKKLRIQSGDDLAVKFGNDMNVTITDVTSLVGVDRNNNSSLGVYTNWHDGLNNIPGGSNYKVFETIKKDPGATPGYYFYRPDGASEWLQNMEDELTNNPTLYNYDELCQTLESWTINTQTYIVDWWIDNISECESWCTWCFGSAGRDFLTPMRPVGGGAPEFGLSGGYAWDNPIVQARTGPRTDISQGIIVLNLAVGNARAGLITMLHEAGGHALHQGYWGGKHKDGEGDYKFLTQQNNIDLKALYDSHYGPGQGAWNEYNTLFPDPNIYYPNELTWLERTFVNQPQTELLAIYKYTEETIEDEFLARVYALMAANKCITFVDDIWPVMKRVNPMVAGPAGSTISGLTHIINQDIAEKIDIEMRDVMRLDMRDYNISNLYGNS
jgi:hypothetical protein